MKKSVILLLMSICLQVMAQERLVPIMERVNVQADTARISQVVDGEWVCVGVAREHAISYDNSLLYKGKPSYRFELKEDDNTLAGYSKGSTKGRAEMSYFQAPSSLGCSRQEHWSGLTFPSPVHESEVV